MQIGVTVLVLPTWQIGMTVLVLLNVRNVVIVSTTGSEKIISEQPEGFGREDIISEPLEGSKKGEVVCKTTTFDDQGALKHLDDLNSDKFLKEVHLVLFVINSSGRMDEEKIETIDNICKVHPCVSKISALLLAGCEGQDEAARGKILEEFRGVTFTKNVIDFMQRGI